MDKKRVLIIDDDVLLVELIKTVLEDEYEVSIATDGETGLMATPVDKPDLILLDIEMSGMNGYEVCRRIRANTNLEFQPAILFVSGNCTPEERLAAYDVGADDFVIKPLEPIELYRKVKQNFESDKERAQLKQSANEAMHVALSAMTDSSALGNIVHFFRKLFTIPDAEELAGALITSLTDYGISGTVMIRHSNGHPPLLRSSDGKSGTMERVLLEHITQEADRIMSYGVRTIFNYGAVSLLIKNMPIDDQDRYGKLKDYLALLVEGAAQRLRSIESESLEQLMEQARLTLTEMERGYYQQQSSMKSALNEMINEFEDALLYMGLRSTQEETLVNLLKNTTEKIGDIQAKGLEIDKYLHQLSKSLTR